MPDSDFFIRFGLFVIKEFLDAQLCAELRSEMFSSKLTSAAVVQGYTSRVSESERKTKEAKVSALTISFVYNRLIALKPGLEKHFNLTLNGCEKPQFLVYNEGDFFLPHVDGEDNLDKPQYFRDRQVSIVVFLNEESKEPAPDTYCGGGLTFYGLIDDPKWKKYGFQLNGETGLMIAFRSGLLHEVKPVTHGTRFAIVSWFF